MSDNQEPQMELQHAAVAYRLSELRRLAGTLRLERRAGRRTGTGPGLVVRLRVALGRRLVALGGTLLEGTGARAHGTAR